MNTSPRRVAARILLATVAVTATATVAAMLLWPSARQAPDSVVGSDMDAFSAMNQPHGDLPEEQVGRVAVDGGPAVRTSERGLGRGLRFRVLTSGGAPAAGAAVRWLSVSRLPDEHRRLDAREVLSDVEVVLARGEHALADALGWVDVPASSSIAVAAAAEDEFGFAELDAWPAGAAIRMEADTCVRIRVVDAQVAPVGDLRLRLVERVAEPATASFVSQTLWSRSTDEGGVALLWHAPAVLGRRDPAHAAFVIDMVASGPVAVEVPALTGRTAAVRIELPRSDPVTAEVRARSGQIRDLPIRVELHPSWDTDPHWPWIDSRMVRACASDECAPGRPAHLGRAVTGADARVWVRLGRDPGVDFERRVRIPAPGADGECRLTIDLPRTLAVLRARLVVPLSESVEPGSVSIWQLREGHKDLLEDAGTVDEQGVFEFVSYAGDGVVRVLVSARLASGALVGAGAQWSGVVPGGAMDVETPSLPRLHLVARGLVVGAERGGSLHGRVSVSVGDEGFDGVEVAVWSDSGQFELYSDRPAEVGIIDFHAGTGLGVTRSVEELLARDVVELHLR